MMIPDKHVIVIVSHMMYSLIKSVPLPTNVVLQSTRDVVRVAEVERASKIEIVQDA